MTIINDKLDLVSMQKEDCKKLFEWVNEPQVRKNALKSNLISWEEHLKWFNNKIKDSNTKIFILKLNNASVGQIRFDYYKNYWLIDFSIDINYRGRGLGKKIIEMGISSFSFPETFVAQVKEDNIASLRVFRQLDFLQVNQFNSVYTFSKTFD